MQLRVHLTAAAFLLFPALGLAQSESDDETLSLGITIQLPTTNCTLTTTADLDMGNWVVGAGSVTCTPSGNTLGCSGSGPEFDSGTPTAAQLEAYTNGNTYTITPDYDSTLEDANGNTVNFSFDNRWIVRYTPSGSWQSVSSSENTRSNLTGETTHTYRFGGQVSGITGETEPDSYEGDIDISLSCS